jgi:hypothetical protein
MHSCVAEERAEELRRQGFTVFDGLYDASWVERMRAAILGIYEEAGRPTCYSPQTKEHQAGLYIGPAGLAIPQLLPRLDPDERVAHPDVIDSLRAFLGEDMRLEIAGAVVSDASRPRFAWHNHVGGHDDGIYRQSGEWPVVDHGRRVMTLTYLQDLDEKHGPLHIQPHRVGEASAPPHDPRLSQWPNEVVLRPRAGSLVVIEECTWHAVLAATKNDKRIFVGLAYASATAELGGWADTKIGDVHACHNDPLLRSLL